MGLHCRAIYGSFFVVFLLVWFLLAAEHLIRSDSHPKTRISNPVPFSPAEHFDYILEPGDDVCGHAPNHSLLLIVYVHSAIENHQRREAIRSTWASRSMFGEYLRVIFILGSSSDVQLMEQVRFEFHTYRDVVQQAFIDSYRNLTHKGKRMDFSFFH